MLRQTSALMEEAARAVEERDKLWTANIEALRFASHESEAKQLARGRVEELEKTLANCQSGNRTLAAVNDRLRAENETLARAVERVGFLESGNRDLVAENDRLRRECQRLSDESIALRRENETLARNVPPEPPSGEDRLRLDLETANRLVEKLIHENNSLRGPVPPITCDDAPEPPAGSVARHLGQQWCRMLAGTKDHPKGCIYAYYDGRFTFFCDVFQHRDGSMAYEPVRISDLPELQQP